MTFFPISRRICCRHRSASLTSWHSVARYGRFSLGPRSSSFLAARNLLSIDCAFSSFRAMAAAPASPPHGPAPPSSRPSRRASQTPRRSTPAWPALAGSEAAGITPRSASRVLPPGRGAAAAQGRKQRWWVAGDGDVGCRQWRRVRSGPSANRRQSERQREMGRERARGIDIRGGGGGGGGGGEKERKREKCHTYPAQCYAGRSRTSRTVQDEDVLRTKILVFRTVQDEDVLNIFGSMLSGEGCRSCTVLALAVTVIKPCLNRKFTVILP